MDRWARLRRPARTQAPAGRFGPVVRLVEYVSRGSSGDACCSGAAFFHRGTVRRRDVKHNRDDVCVRSMHRRCTGRYDDVLLLHVRLHGGGVHRRARDYALRLAWDIRHRRRAADRARASDARCAGRVDAFLGSSTPVDRIGFGCAACMSFGVRAGAQRATRPLPPQYSLLSVNAKVTTALVRNPTVGRKADLAVSFIRVGSGAARRG